ncbi:unnamed protein product [Pleuronectes platessa]|uniref:Uncharacterized protein n=1 Tax=Pleuronectes platessa TaxID=8262 RepID=A0A9N7V4T8_PLEPL|nr:unnamed protein product [Pleuronectes platessa]
MCGSHVQEELNLDLIPPNTDSVEGSSPFSSPWLSYPPVSRQPLEWQSFECQLLSSSAPQPAPPLPQITRVKCGIDLSPNAPLVPEHEEQVQPPHEHLAPRPDGLSLREAVNPFTFAAQTLTCREPLRSAQQLSSSHTPATPSSSSASPVSPTYRVTVSVRPVGLQVSGPAAWDKATINCRAVQRAPHRPAHKEQSASYDIKGIVEQASAQQPPYMGSLCKESVFNLSATDSTPTERYVCHTFTTAICQNRRPIVAPDTSFKSSRQLIEFVYEAFIHCRTFDREESQVVPRQSFPKVNTGPDMHAHALKHTPHNAAPRGLGHPADSILFPLKGSCVTKDNLASLWPGYLREQSMLGCGSHVLVTNNPTSCPRPAGDIERADPGSLPSRGVRPGAHKTEGSCREQGMSSYSVGLHQEMCPAQHAPPGTERVSQANLLLLSTDQRMKAAALIRGGILLQRYV